MYERLENLDTDETLDWEVPFFHNPYELSPYKDYYQQFPEGFLMYINQDPMIEPLKAKDFDKLIRFTLARYGIDYLHPCFHLKLAQKKLYLYFKNKRKDQMKYQRSKEVLEDETTFNKLVENRFGELRNFFSEENLNGKFY